MIIDHYERINNQEFIDKFLSISNLPNNFLEILEDCTIFMHIESYSYIYSHINIFYLFKGG